MNDPHNYNIVNPIEKRAQKHEVFFLWCKKECPLTFTERLILSILVKAERMAGKGTSQAKIAAWTGLSPKAIRKSLRDGSRLLTSGLVVRDHYRLWRAVEPPEATASWFSVRKTKGKHWADRLAYWPVDLGDPDDNVCESVFWGLLTLLKGQGDAVKHECYESLAVLLGCEYRRIKKAVKRLVENHSIEVINTAKNRYRKIIRFDILFLDAEAVQVDDVPVELDSVPQTKVEEKIDPLPRPFKSLFDQRQADRIAAFRAVESKMKERLQGIGFQQWQIGQAMWAMGYVPQQDKEKVFHAIVHKHGHSAEAVLSALEEHVEYRKRKQRSETQELLRLEAMSECVVA